MQQDAAPFLDDLTGVPTDGRAWWLTTSDGVRVRAGLWPAEAARGTVLMFPGRTEYIEKYGPVATAFRKKGFGFLAVDWRGQGLADRLLPDRRVGHVVRFTDFQMDVAAVLDLASRLDLPRPWHLIGHSMGGAIALRAAMQGAPVQSCAFTGPMWGIRIASAMRVAAQAVYQFSRVTRQGHRLSPSTKYEHYVLTDPFEGNMLTTDPAMWQMMGDHLRAYPELALGGPSINWLGQALGETEALFQRPSPDLPCLTFLGSAEAIVDVPRIHERMGRWPGGRLELVTGGQHEVLLEPPAIRDRIVDQLIAHFDAAAPPVPDRAI
ncbi:MAG: alpha/beta hydrolase [Rhodobacteraceae bacterium]|nr:alpha/beta hydrolase [Paracoccaceae bacterium]